MVFSELEEGDFFEYNGFVFEKGKFETGFNARFGNLNFLPEDKVKLVSEILPDRKLSGVFSFLKDILKSLGRRQR